MFTFFNVLIILVALGNFATVTFNGGGTISKSTRKMVDDPHGPALVRFTLGATFVWSAYLCLLAFPLRELNPVWGAAWMGLMIVSVCESIYTSRLMWAAVMKQASVSFALQDSLPYRVWHALQSVATIAVCVVLIAPQQ